MPWDAAAIATKTTTSDVSRGTSGAPIDTPVTDSYHGGTVYVVRQWQGGHIEGVTSQLTRRHVPYQIIEAWNNPVYPALKKGDAVVGLGGPGSVNDLGEAGYHGPLRDESKFVLEAEAQHIPFLGICLSHQLKARLDGHPVGQQGSFVFGIQPVELTDAGRQHWLFKGMPSQLYVYEAHHDQVMNIDHDAHGAMVLATSKNSPVEAVAWDSNTVTVQFHPDARSSDVIDAVENPQALASTGKSMAENMRTVPANYSDYLDQFFENFLTHAGFPSSHQTTS